METISIPAIALCCYMIAEIIKAAGGERVKKFLPPVCGILGGCMAVLLWIFAPETIGNVEITTAIASGIVSGLSATGVHQIYKQLKNWGENNADSK